MAIVKSKTVGYKIIQYIMKNPGATRKEVNAAVLTSSKKNNPSYHSTTWSGLVRANKIRIGGDGKSYHATEDGISYVKGVDEKEFGVVNDKIAQNALKVKKKKELKRIGLNLVVLLLRVKDMKVNTKELIVEEFGEEVYSNEINELLRIGLLIVIEGEFQITGLFEELKEYNPEVIEEAKSAELKISKNPETVKLREIEGEYRDTAIALRVVKREIRERMSGKRKEELEVALRVLESGMKRLQEQYGFKTLSEVRKKIEGNLLKKTVKTSPKM